MNIIRGSPINFFSKLLYFSLEVYYQLFQTYEYHQIEKNIFLEIFFRNEIDLQIRNFERL